MDCSDETDYSEYTEGVGNMVTPKETIQAYENILKSIQSIRELPLNDRMDIAYKISATQRTVDGVSENLVFLTSLDYIRTLNQQESEKLVTLLDKTLDSQGQIVTLIKNIFERQTKEDEDKLEKENKKKGWRSPFTLSV